MRARDPRSAGPLAGKPAPLTVTDAPGGPWHAANLPSLLATLATTEDGLTQAEAAARLRQYGPNLLPESRAPARWRVFARQFRSPLIYILAIAAALSVAVGDAKDAAFIAAVLVLNALIGGIQEWRAQECSRALQKLLTVRAAVMRGGEACEVDAAELVPGDAVWLESGNRVPADVRLTAAQGLRVDESLLTGESLPVAKEADTAGLPPDTPLADRTNLGHAGSTVVRGRGHGVVVATGTDIAVGQLALDVAGARPGQPPLLERMGRFTRAIAIVGLATSAAVAAVGWLAWGHAASEMAFFAVALTVSAIPEGLPVALTIALAIATSRMARRGVVVRRLAAVEGLGSCTLIASDKTGTLTCNELTVREVWLPGGETYQVTDEGYRPDGQVLAGGRRVEPGESPRLDALARAAALCNEADLHRRDGNGDWAWRGDPTEVALLAFAHKLDHVREASLERHPQVDQIPFEPEHKFSATFHRFDGTVQALVKGAPERVAAMCGAQQAAADWAQAAARSMADRGLRVLALAEGTAPADLDTAGAPDEPRGLTLLGIVGMIDPLRAGVREAVRDCHGAGVSVWMVTGDHPVTALAIARQLGLASEPGQVLTGAELAAKPESEIADVARTTRVFARVSPQQKLLLVDAARAAGHFVAVTGDGANDAPALRAANIGVAMGRGGTDVAREAAELVIADDNFATIVAGIEEGRVAYKNVRNVIFMVVATGAGEVVLASLAMAFGAPLPLQPVQLLWLNLVTNGIQDVGLAFEPGSGNELRRPPRPPRESIFNRVMVERTLLSAAVIGGVGFGAFAWMLRHGWSEPAARNALLLLVVLFENVLVGNARSETRQVLGVSPLRNPLLLAGVGVALLVHLAAMYLPPLQAVLKTAPLDLMTWIVMAALALSLFVAIELHKWRYAQRASRPTVSGRAKATGSTRGAIRPDAMNRPVSAELRGSEL